MNPDQVQESADLSPSADETAAAAEAARQLHESTQTGKNKKLSPSAIKRPRDKSRHGRPLSTIESSSSASGSEMGDADSERDGSDTEEVSLDCSGVCIT